VGAVPSSGLPSRYQPINLLGRSLWSLGPPIVRMAGRIGLSLRYELPESLPRPPFVLASNHYSHFDPPAIGSVIGTPIRFLALDELSTASRFLARFLPTVGVVTVSRQRSSIGGVRTALETLGAGEAVGVFPEGIRVAHWGERIPKRGAAWLAIQARVPLVPVAVIGSGRAFGVDNRLHRAPIRVVVGPAMTPENGDSSDLTRRWADWVEGQVKRYPGSEVTG